MVRRSQQRGGAGGGLPTNRRGFGAIPRLPGGWDMGLSVLRAGTPVLEARAGAARRFWKTVSGIGCGVDPHTG